MISFRVDGENAGKRLDVIIPKQAEGVSRSMAQNLLGDGRVRVNGQVEWKKNRKAEPDDLVELSVPAYEEAAVLPENIPLDIYYEDEDVIVVNKPRGMVVHPGAGNMTGTLVNALLFHCGDRLSDLNGPVRPGIVHRIDKDTSGLLMAAKTNEAHASLARQLAEHSTTRRYLALVRDNIREKEGTVDQPLGRDPKNRLRRAVNGENPKRAVTHFRVLERYGPVTLVECRLETGRTHQIRVHMAYIGHPLLGDPLYGPRKTRSGAEGQFLHAAVLGFRHPVTGQYLEFRADPPEPFLHELDLLRMKYGVR